MKCLYFQHLHPNVEMQGKFTIYLQLKATQHIDKQTFLWYDIIELKCYLIQNNQQTSLKKFPKIFYRISWQANVFML